MIPQPRLHPTREGGGHTVVSYSVTSCEVPTVRYWTRGVAGEVYSRAKIVFRKRRSIKWASQAGYFLRGRSIRMTGPWARGARVTGVAGILDRTWKMGTQLSQSPGPSSLSCSVVRGRVRGRLSVPSSSGTLEVSGPSVKTQLLLEGPNIGPLGCRRL